MKLLSSSKSSIITNDLLRQLKHLRIIDSAPNTVATEYVSFNGIFYMMTAGVLDQHWIVATVEKPTQG